jgi:hypothetical protein
VTGDRRADRPPKIGAGSVGAAFFKRVAGFAERGAALPGFRVGIREQGREVDRRGLAAARAAFCRERNRILREGMRAFLVLGRMMAAPVSAVAR